MVSRGLAKLKDGLFGLVILTSRLKQHEGYFGKDLVILNSGQMTRTTPELAPSRNFYATPTCGRLDTTYDLTCNMPHTRRIFSGIGCRTGVESRDLTTRPPRLRQTTVKL
ncbi:hypothetical protein AVEN_239465-1 [Araneus ventricosus]|uniref:Uncharacterized protein n=1 Tax=Araneus ventricosus TaxID=182803 RepID=A0A4Y2MWD4_ARAVE|nr:hypothetical protein AVEN_239465-1 [Araneus ventricosus]